MKKQRKTTFIALFSMLAMVLVGISTFFAITNETLETKAEPQVITVIFPKASSDSTSAFTTSTIETGANSLKDAINGQYIDTNTIVTRVYAGTKGFKYGTGSAVGVWEFTTTYAATKIKVTLNQYGSDATSTAKVTAGSSFATSDIISTDTLVTLDSISTNSFKIEQVKTSSGRFYLSEIEFTFITAEFGTLDRIELNTGNVQTEFGLGETFSSTGLIVTAYDTSNATKDVSSEATTNHAGIVFGEQHLGSRAVIVSYQGKQAEYSISVIKKIVYKEIIYTSEIKLGATYSIGAKSVQMVMTEPSGANKFFGNALVSTQTDGEGYTTFEGPSVTLRFELVRGSLAGTYSFEILNGSHVGKYIAAPTDSSKNELHIIDSIIDQSSWNLQNYPDITSVSISNRNIRYNAASPRFATYTSAQTGVQLYVDEDTIPAESFGNLHHIEIATDLAKTSYFVGEPFSNAGLIVTGYDGADPETANEMTITEYTTSPDNGYVFLQKDIGPVDIIVTVNVDGVSKSEDYEVEVFAGRTFNKVTSQSDLLFKHTYTFATEGEAMSSVVSNFASPIDINYADGSFTEVTQLLTVSLEIGKVKGSYAFKILSGASAGRYLAYTGSSTGLSQVTTLDDKASWFVVFEEGDYVHIASAISENRGIVYNETNDRFAAYAHTYEGNVQTFLYSESGLIDSTEEALALATEVNEGVGEGAKGKCHEAYDFLKDVYDRLSSAGQAAFVMTSSNEDIAAAAARYAYLENWVALNPNPDGSPSILDITSTQTITIVIIISVLGISTLAGYYFIRKRPKEETTN